MTTLTKVASSLFDSVIEFKNRLCTDGQFCDDMAMTALAGITVWMMVVAMQPLM